MLRFSNVGDPQAYFTQHLAKGDYYLDGQEGGGVWQGKGAEILGLEGEVESADFAKLCQNRLPGTDQKLTPRDNPNRREGVDLSFHCPKSVSLLYGLSSDEKIKESVQEAVRKTMSELERDAQVRVRKGREKNTDLDRTTGNLMWGEFVHKTARPVNGVPDPHLHVHCYVFNASYDEKETRFKAAQLGAIRRDASYYEACFHSHLADELCRQGYEIESKGKAWEIKGFERKTLEKFSARTKEVEAKAREKEEQLGRKLTDKERDGLAAQTRSRKAKEEIPYRQLRGKWAERLSGQEKETILAIHKGRDPERYQQQGAEREAAGEAAIAHALSHCLERKSVVSEKYLLTTAMRHSIGQSSSSEINRSLDIHTDVLRARDGKGKRMISTYAVKTEEEMTLAFARQGKGKCEALNPNADYGFTYDFLNAQQRAAVQHVISTKDQVAIIQGKAGVGKTTTIKEASLAIKEGGREVFTFAPTAEATKILQGDGFEKASTVSRLLVDKKLQQEISDQVIWIDEAGLVSGKMMNGVFAIAKEQNARVVLSGDTRQHHSVARGDAMRQLAEQANLPIADIDQIQRQKGQYREAVEAVSQGRTAEGFEVLDTLGWVEEIENEKERGKTLADAYVKRISEGRTALVVSPTHKEKDRVTKEIRAGLQEKGLLKEEEATTIRQINLNWTEAQRKDIRNYEAGQAIQFTQNCPGIKRGERMRIIEGQTPESLMAQRQNGEQIEIPLDQAGRFQVYRQKEMALMQGDRIAITQNGFCQDDKGKKKRLINGMVYEVKACKEEGKVHLKNGWVIDQSFGHIDHGYCTTSYKAQGKTVDHVFLAQSVESNPAASREQFYVSVSRAKRSVTIYTDDKKELKQAVYGSQERQTVKELEAEDQHYQKKKRTQERKDMFAENASSSTKAQEREKGPEPPQVKEKSLETTEKPLTEENEPVLEKFTAQIEEITEPEAEGLTRDAGKKLLTPVQEDGGKTLSPSLAERRKKKRISIRSLVGVMGQYMSMDEKERAEIQKDLKICFLKDESRRRFNERLKSTQQYNEKNRDGKDLEY